MSRSFGDLAYKRLGLSSVPDVKVFNFSAPRDHFLLLGCDGFWGIFGAEDAVQFASAELAKGSSAKHTCSRLINEVCPNSNCGLLLAQAQCVPVCVLQWWCTSSWQDCQ